MKTLALQNIRRHLIWMLFLFCTLFLVAGCNDKQVSVPAGQSKLKAAVTIVPQATFVKAVGGDLVDVVTMVPPGGNPENYSPTPQQMMEFSNAQIYFAIGVPSEKATILPKIKDLNPDIKLLDLPALVDQKYPPHVFATGERDPHMWLSPKRVKEIVLITAEELSQLDPAHRDIFESNAQAYNTELDQLDQDIRASLTSVSNKTIIVYHPAFGYFAEDYGLNMVALEEEGKEATAINLQKVIDLAKKENIKVIFYQAEIDSKQSHAMAAEIGGQAEMIAPLDPDYINNLQKTVQTFARVLR
ncbi:MAG: zinc ABC transporter substrate-binding protein [Syntrophomonas sp.]|nr:zinc ABC transporter substrate-binding protein [Syntrophomonas sp.]